MNRAKAFVLLLSLALYTQLRASEKESENSTRFQLYPAPPGPSRSEDYIVRVNGKPVDLYAAPTRYGSTATFGYFDFQGKVEVEVVAPFAPSHSTSFAVLPAKYGVVPNQRDNKRMVLRNL